VASGIVSLRPDSSVRVGLEEIYRASDDGQYSDEPNCVTEGGRRTSALWEYGIILRRSNIHGDPIS
jgi:hypothetical protein